MIVSMDVMKVSHTLADSRYPWQVGTGEGYCIVSLEPQYLDHAIDVK